MYVYMTICICMYVYMTICTYYAYKYNITLLCNPNALPAAHRKDGRCSTNDIILIAHPINPHTKANTSIARTPSTAANNRLNK